MTQQLEFLEIIENLPDVLLIAQPDGEIIFANAAAAHSLAVESSAVLIGLSLFDLAQGEQRDRLKEAFDGRLSRRASAVELKLVLSGGTGCCVELAIVRDIDFEDERAVLIIARDVTAQRALELQVQLSNRLSSLGTLSAGVAHEINNPLAFVMSNLEFVSGMLKELPAAVAPELVTEMTEALAEATGGTARIRNIVRDLKTFARGNDEDPRAGQVAPAIEWALKLTSVSVQHRCRLESDVSPTPAVRGAHSKLSQVLVNLINNACDAMPNSQLEGSIRVAARTDPQGNAVIEVTDNGSGIPAALLGRVFEPFFTTKAIGRGTGLGLSVSMGIVRGMGGTMDVQSEVGVGTTFRIVLPPASAAPELPSVVQKVGQPRGMRILVIDDEPGIGSALTRMFGREHEVVTLGDAMRALELVRLDPDFDVVLCDLMMPGISGVEVYCAARAVSQRLASRFVFLTGGVASSSVQEKLDGLTVPMIAKPFARAELEQLFAQLGRSSSAEPGR